MALAQSVHDLESSDGGVSRFHRFESECGLDQRFELAVVGLDYIVAIFDEERFLPVFETLQGVAEKPLRCFGVACLGQVEINRTPLLIHCPVEIDPWAAFLNVGLVDMPASSPAGAAPSPAQTFSISGAYRCTQRYTVVWSR